MPASSFPKRYYEGDTEPSNSSSGSGEVAEVIKALEAADIPSCVVGTHALVYFGAGRVADEWDICVPDAQLAAAQRLLDGCGKYERAEPVRPYISSQRHLFPTYKQKGVRFFFILAPASAWFVDPRPEYCERSQMDIPYPQDVYYTRSLIALQDLADLADMVDAQNLTLEWGKKHLDFSMLKQDAAEFAKAVNKRLEGIGGIDINRDFEHYWTRAVEGKEGRIEPLKRGRYITRWRPRASPGDPRRPDPKRGVAARNYV